MTAISTPAAVLPPLSQSRYELLACPHLYVDRIIRGREEAPNEYAERGTAVHARLKSYVNHLVQTRQRTDFAVLDGLMADLDGDARAILEGLREHLVIDPEKVLGTEMYLAADEGMNPLDSDPSEATQDGMVEPPAPAYEGTPDYIELADAVTADILDYKTYWQIVDAESFQSRFYPLLVFLHFPQVERVRFHLKFVRYGEATRSAEFAREKDLPKLVKSALDARARQIALHKAFAGGDEITAMPGKHCAWCPKLNSDCPIKQMNPYAEMSAEDRARFGVWLAAAAKENTRILKDLVNVRGPITVADGNGRNYVAGFNVQRRTNYPLKPCAPLVMNEDFADKLTIGGLSSPLKAKKRAELKDKLDAHALSVPTTKFSISGAADEEEEP